MLNRPDAYPNVRQGGVNSNRGEVCMKGSIYTDEKCPICGGILRHNEHRDGFFCENHPKRRIIPNSMRVHFDERVRKRFKDYRAARQFLEGLRWKTSEGTFDYRDYQPDNPLGFENLANKWLAHKKQYVSHNHYRNIERDIKKAISAWGQMNVKAIGYGELQDFFDSLKLSSKSKSEARSALHSFFTWLCKREKTFDMPDMPEIKFTLGWRNIVDIDTQTAIISEVKRISWNVNPKIWIGIKWLATYIAFRPNELRMLKESEINVSGFFVVPKPKERKPKLIAMLPEDIELYEQYRGMPNLYFFRHIRRKGQKPGAHFGKDYFYTWWRRACANLGIEGVDLYGGTRHSTTTALSEHFTKEQIQDAGTIHASNKAFMRYYQAETKNSQAIYAKAADLQKDKKGKVVSFLKKDQGDG